MDFVRSFLASGRTNLKATCERDNHLPDFSAKNGPLYRSGGSPVRVGKHQTISCSGEKNDKLQTVPPGPNYQPLVSMIEPGPKRQNYSQSTLRFHPEETGVRACFCPRSKSKYTCSWRTRS
ncbi:hypothetical protein RRG08_062140 [Elysia crispata]|uniref:Uncharacterized protein n=1 Tax=Elysia crispata TaxID=231223 RepID=A0AAE0YPS9_9GAST|nr:hypothetical protein RRG08_062140 [Elysia crispata]